jgi:hypothetical protein
MKFLINLLLIAFLSFVACLFLPWWSIALVAFLVIALIPLRPGRAFLAGFLAIFFLWGIMSFVISQNNDHLLASKASLLILKMDNPFLLMLATALIGGLVAGFAALTASFLRKKTETVVVQSSKVPADV